MAVKLADIAANVKGLAKLDPGGFARMYLAEKLSLLSKTKGPSRFVELSARTDSW